MTVTQKVKTTLHARPAGDHAQVGAASHEAHSGNGSHPVAAQKAKPAQVISLEDDDFAGL
ncbi:MAG: hypothetical protein HY042_04090 [Spirochaetia bacterium]|nr:hypothetical protein [Spirochaetia bacterium]